MEKLTITKKDALKIYANYRTGMDYRGIITETDIIETFRRKKRLPLEQYIKRLRQTIEKNHRPQEATPTQ